MKKEGKSSFLKSITPGERLWLREHVQNQIETREWTFKRVEKDGTTLLIHESGSFGCNVKVEGIDWKAHQKAKKKMMQG